MRHVEKTPYKRSGNYSTGRHASTEGNHPIVPNTVSALDPRAHSFHVCRACKLRKTDKT
jgi:hypothetical protein